MSAARLSQTYLRLAVNLLARLDGQHAAHRQAAAICPNGAASQRLETPRTRDPAASEHPGGRGHAPARKQQTTSSDIVATHALIAHIAVQSSNSQVL